MTKHSGVSPGSVAIRFLSAPARRRTAGKRARAPAALILLAFALNITSSALGAGRTVYTDTRMIADNLKFTDTILWNDDVGREESYSLELTGPGEAYPIIMADDTVYGGMTITQLTQYASEQGYNVLAAMNTDFFSVQTGVPIGVAVENGVYISSPGPAGTSTVSFDEYGGVHFSKGASVTITLTNNGGETSADDGGETSAGNAGKTAVVTNFNKYRHSAGGLYLFSSSFSAVSTRTGTPGWFVRFKILDGYPAVSGEMSLMVTDTYESAEAIEIGDGYLVLSADEAGGYAGVRDSFAPGDLVTVTTQCDDEYLRNARWATGGGDIIISGGAITDPETWDKTLLGKHPRTALGVKSDGSILAYVLDGRSSTHSEGATLAALAEEMLRQGCVEAVNLDGGGSSAMSVKLTGDEISALVNKPSDGAERKCSTYLLFVTDLAPDGVPRRLALRNNGVIALPGASFDLEFAASDGGFAPSAPPYDAAASSSGGLGSVEGVRYTAGPDAGVDTLALYSPSSGAFGSGEVYIIKSPTSLTVTRDGGNSGLTSLFVRPGENVRLTPSSTYYRRSVTAQPGAYAYVVSGDIGVVDADGLFVAADIVSSAGTVTVSAGDKTVTVNVEVKGFDDVSEHWAKEYIYALAAEDIVTGATPDSFAPDAPMKRGDFVLMLHRAAGSPKTPLAPDTPAEPETETSGTEEPGADTAPEARIPVTAFTDVFTDDYYAEAVVWARSVGVTQGVGDGVFAPLSELSRQEAFTLAYRALAQLGVSGTDGSPSAGLSRFADAETVADYARESVAALADMGIVEGADGALAPESRLTRAQMAKILKSILGYEPPMPEPEPTPEPESHPTPESYPES
ncbi:MAG: phosphodiester glycosidase family protein [Oscillospiraceae bacterium]|nr:phosphodiester glycosidase family protein [Oscillospiraceae bacterium]